MSGYQRASKGDFGNDRLVELDKSINRYRWFLLFFNVLSILVALVTFCVCIWIRFDLDFREWIVEIDWYSYWHAMYAVMLSMICVAIVSIIGIFGVVEEKRGLLVLFTVCLIVMFIFHLIAAIVITLWGVEESPVLIKELREVFLELVHGWDVDPRKARILRQIQEYVGCCGGKGSEDFIAAHKPVPFECRDRATGSEYRYGCQQQFAWWLEPWTGYLAGVSVIMMVADVFGIWGSQKLNNLLRQYNYEQNEY